MEQQDLLTNDLSLTPVSQENLLISAKWGKFLSIIGFVFCGFLVIGGFTVSMFLTTSGFGEGMPFMQYLGFIYILFAVILFFPCLYLLKFSNKMQEGIRSSNQESIDVSFANLKSMFKFYGVVTVVVLGFYALIFLFGIGSTMMR